jgi:CBS domain containing-hemolysin-like protein
MDSLGLLLVFIFFSGFFSATEMAFVVANKIKIEVKARKNKPAAKNAMYYILDQKNFFSTILIGNNIVNIAFASFSTVVFTQIFGFSEVTILILSTVIILVFGELLPKYFARELADRFILVSMIPLRIIGILLYPFIKILSGISAVFIRSKNISQENINFLFTRDDIGTLVKESQEAGIVHKNESDIITRVLALSDQRVYEAMRPRTEIVGVDLEDNIDEVLNTFIESGYSKMPVFEDNLDNIKGVVFAYDLFKKPQDIKSILREVVFVPETKKSYEMLNEFLKKGVSIAVVIDEFGGTAGIVTIEDIMEELFGEIKDEYDVEENICRKISPDSYLISGKVEIDFINEKYHLNIPQGDYETLGGYITSTLGRIPAQGETVIISNYNILIVRSSNTRIDIIKLSLIGSEALTS